MTLFSSWCGWMGGNTGCDIKTAGPSAHSQLLPSKLQSAVEYGTREKRREETVQQQLLHCVLCRQNGWVISLPSFILLLFIFSIFSFPFHLFFHLHLRLVALTNSETAQILSLPHHSHSLVNLHSSPISPASLARTSMTTSSSTLSNGPVSAAQKPAKEPKTVAPTASVNLQSAKDSTGMNKTKTPILAIDFTRAGRPRRASTHLASKELHDFPSDSSATNLVSGGCCGGSGCCRLASSQISSSSSLPTFAVPDNRAFKSLKLNLAPLNSRNRLTNTTPLPVQTISLNPVSPEVGHESTVYTHPPKFVTPHPPHSVFAAKIAGTRELTKPGAEKRTYHFDIDVTDYPDEHTGVDFRVGGAIGICAPNNFDAVDEIFDILGVSPSERDEPVTLQTQGGRWPTVWGDEEERSLATTRRELLTWTVDIQSYPPTKNILRLLAEYAKDDGEKTILLYLCSKQGQAAFCE